MTDLLPLHPVWPFLLGVILYAVAPYSGRAVRVLDLVGRMLVWIAGAALVLATTGLRE